MCYLQSVFSIAFGCRIGWGHNSTEINLHIFFQTCTSQESTGSFSLLGAFHYYCITVKLLLIFKRSVYQQVQICLSRTMRLSQRTTKVQLVKAKCYLPFQFVNNKLESFRTEYMNKCAAVQCKCSTAHFGFFCLFLVVVVFFFFNSIYHLGKNTSEILI